MANFRHIINHVSNNIVGRLANTYGDIRLDNVDVLLKFVSRTTGNHLEIGTLYGGSAIAVALLKKELCQDGMVVCIDPLDGYYGSNDISGVLVVPEILFLNIVTFEVGNRILVMKAKSQPCANLGMEFSTAYIDGDHKFEKPLMDWLCVKDVVSRYVIFDNCDDKHPAVQIACMVANNDPEWECVYDSGITYVVERLK